MEQDVLSRCIRRQPSVWFDRIVAHFGRETTTGRLIPQIDGLRFAAIGLVILFHVNGYLVAKWPLPGHLAQSSWLAQIALVGFRGVELFFVISGFILALPFAGHYLRGAPPVNLRNYYLRRLTRLEPPYIATLMLLFGLTVLVQGKSGAQLLPHLLAGLMYSHSLIYGVPNGIAWSLEIEVQFYVLVPLLTLMFAIRRVRLRRAIFVALIFGSEVAQVLWVGNHARASLSILGYLQFFVIGFLLADIFLSDWRESPEPRRVWDLVALCGWPLVLTFLRFDWFAAWIFPFAILLLYCAVFKGRTARRVFANRWAVLIGGMCYSTYLIHYLVISAVGRFSKGIGAGQSYWIYLPLQALLVGVPIILICGLYFAILEKPCMRRDWPQRLRERAQRLRARIFGGQEIATRKPIMAAAPIPAERVSGD
jgi:peptidoglycan/LPS O-acetylase OafA/YrhL